MIGFIGTSVTISRKYNQLQRYRYYIHFQFTVAHALGFSVFTSRFPATDLKTVTSTSNHYELFLSLLLQSSWNAYPNLRFHFSSLCTAPVLTNFLYLFPLAFTIRFLARIYNTGTIKVALNHTLPISLYYSTLEVFKSHVNSSQVDF
jgi:hypothetical protein